MVVESHNPRPLFFSTQVHGAAGVSSDTPLAQLYAGARALRLADGPDDVHLASIGRDELKKMARSRL